jgi:uncharacterized protein (TIGR03437 family)
MHRSLILVLSFVLSTYGADRHHAPVEPVDPGGVLQRLTVARFNASGRTAVQAAAADPFGNILVTGATAAPDFPVKNAAQPAFAEARIVRTTDLGATWKPVGSPSADVSRLGPDPADPRVLFAGGTFGIYKSADSGATWRVVVPLKPGTVVGAIVVDPGNHLRVAALLFGPGLIRSLDGGETWTATGNSGSQLLVDPAGSGALAMDNSISRDWGITFQRLTTVGSVLAFDPSHQGWIWGKTSAGVIGTPYLSKDFGATWTAKTPLPDTFSDIQDLAIDPAQSDTLYAVAADGLFVSADGATSWKGTGHSFLFQQFTPLAIPGAGWAAPGGLFAIGTATSYGYIGSNQVAFSPDYGATWQTPKLTGVTSVVTGPGCAVYATKPIATDGFVAKLAPDGTVLWASYLGGSDQDQPAALASDAQGNVYVAGTTWSADFPATAPRIGPTGLNAAFVTKYSASGVVVWSVLVGGEAQNSATALAVDGAGGVYLAGRTDSAGFPVTPGALVSALDAGSYTGFLTKLGPDARLAWSTFLGSSYTYAGAVVVDAAGEPILAGNGPVPGQPPPADANNPVFVMKLDGGGTRVLASQYIAGSSPPSGAPGVNLGPGTAALAQDRNGNIFLFAATGSDVVTSPGAYNAPQPAAGCPSKYGPLGNAFVTKLLAPDWGAQYRAMLRAPCGIVPGQIAVSPDGSAVLSMASGGGLPLNNPLLGGPACLYLAPFQSSAVAKISPDGTALEFATYLDNCMPPGIALAADGSVYAGVTSTDPNGPAGVLRVPASGAGPVLNSIANAFSGDATAVVEGGLFALMPGYGPGSVVTFDGVPVSPLRFAAGRAIVTVPPLLHRRDGTLPSFTMVQIVAGGQVSNPVWMPVAARLPGLMTRSYPDLPVAAYPGPDAFALNADGTVNDAAHPAAAGSPVTLFATGMGEPPLPPVYTSWDQLNLPPPSSGAPPGAAVSPAPGMPAGVYQVVEAVPANVKTGTPDANGVYRVPVALQFQLYYGSFPPPASNTVYVYVR